MKKSELKKLIDGHFFNLYYKAEGCFCNEGIEGIMTKIERQKQQIIQNHINNVYPIKEMKKGGNITYYTKLSPKERNHSGKITAKNIADLELKIVAYYEGISINNITFSELIKTLEEQYIDDNQASTGKRHRQIFNQYFTNLSNIKVNELTASMLEKTLKDIINNGIKKRGFSNVKVTLRQLYKHIKRNKIQCIDIPQIIEEFEDNLTGKHHFIQNNKQSKNLVFTEEETKELLQNAIKYPSYKSLFLGLILTTGCRVGELLCMRYSNVDLENRIFFVSEIEDKERNIKSYTKNNECREVYLNDNALSLLKLLLHIRKYDKHDTNFLFLNDNSDDGKLHLRAIDDYTRNIQIKLNFDSKKEIRSLHDGRRTYATLQYLSGVKLKNIQRQLGHSSITQTEEYIIDLVDNKKRGIDLEKGNLAI